MFFRIFWLLHFMVLLIILLIRTKVIWSNKIHCLVFVLCLVMFDGCGMNEKMCTQKGSLAECWMCMSNINLLGDIYLILCALCSFYIKLFFCYFVRIESALTPLLPLFDHFSDKRRLHLRFLSPVMSACPIN